MEFIELFSVFVTLIGVLMSLANFPQAFRMWKNKSANDVSLLMVSIMAFGTLVWTVYGLLVNDFVVAISFGVGVVGTWLCLVLKIKFDKEAKLRKNYTTKKT